MVHAASLTSRIVTDDSLAFLPCRYSTKRQRSKRAGGLVFRLYPGRDIRGRKSL